jgi:hypothetical protein
MAVAGIDVLRAVTSLALGVASPSARGPRLAPVPSAGARVPVPVGPGPGRGAWDRIAEPSDPPWATMLAPWEEAPALAGICVVTTRPFPQEWWRRPRTTPPPETPFLGRPAAVPIRSEDGATVVPSAGPPRGSGDPIPGTGWAPAERHGSSQQGPSRRGSARSGSSRSGASEERHHGRFARLCLVIAAALISFIVVDAALGNGRR